MKTRWPLADTSAAKVLQAWLARQLHERFEIAVTARVALQRDMVRTELICSCFSAAVERGADGFDG
jgi:hypothetical protein